MAIEHGPDRALSSTLLVQCNTRRDEDYEDMIDHVSRPGAGLILTGQRALAAARQVVGKIGYNGPVLVDAARYASRTHPASAPFDGRFLDRQRELGLPWVLPDAGYIDLKESEGLVSVLSRVRDMDGGVLAPLALSWQWLSADRRGWLIDQITQAGVPVAIALQHNDDPLGVKYALEGLIALLAVPNDVVLLRCDASAIGALCFGALAAAVGTTTRLRHIPGGGGGGGGSGGHDPSPILPPCLTYRRLSHILLAVANDPDNPLWACECPTCYGRPISVLANASDPEAACAAHSVDFLCKLRDDLFGEHKHLTRAQRQQSWISQCSHAASRCTELASQFPVADRKPPSALRHWIEIGGREIKEQTAR